MKILFLLTLDIYNSQCTFKTYVYCEISKSCSNKRDLKPTMLVEARHDRFRLPKRLRCLRKNSALKLALLKVAKDESLRILAWRNAFVLNYSRFNSNVLKHVIRKVDEIFEDLDPVDQKNAPHVVHKKYT